MSNPQHLLSKSLLTLLILTPLGIMGWLSIVSLYPNLKDPVTKIYSSAIGYPAYQRMMGRAIAVEIATVEPQNLTSTLAAPGESVPLLSVDIRSLIPAQVQAVLVTEGERVTQGQALIKLDPTSLENTVEQLRNDLAISQGELRQLEASSQAQLKEQAAEVIALEKRTQEAAKNLQLMEQIAAQEIKNNTEAAQARLETARLRLGEMEDLVEEGGISRFSLYQAQDDYNTRQKELLNAQQGDVYTQYQLHQVKDNFLDAQSEETIAREKLNLAKITLADQLQQARLKVQTHEVKLREALKDLENSVIYANTEGLVSKVNINPGELSLPNSRDPLLVLSQNTVFQAYIDQAQIEQVKVGDGVSIRLVAYPGRVFEGKVIQVNPTVETESLTNRRLRVDKQYTYSVWCEIPELDMPSGLQGFAEFKTQDQSLVIPESSLIHFSGGEGMVMVVENGEAVLKKVQLGEKIDDLRVVISGLELGEQVVMYPRGLEPGDQLVNE